jgi:hypothetical protein
MGDAQKGARCVGRRRGRGSQRACALVHGDSRGRRTELIERSHGAERGSERAGETAHHADETGPRGRDGKGACGRGRLAPIQRPH